MELVYLDPTATLNEVEKICRRAVEEKYKRLTVPPLFVKKAKEAVAGTLIKISTVIGYPFGWSAIESKVAEVILAMVDGADELDVVINITALKNNDWQFLAKELNTLMTIIRKQERGLNIIIESELMVEEEVARCCDLYGAAGVDSLILSTGTLSRLPGFSVVRLFRRHLGDHVKIRLFAPNADNAAIELYTNAGAEHIGIFVK